MASTIGLLNTTMDSVSHSQPSPSSMFNATNTSSSCSFDGFSTTDLSYVPPHIWELLPRKDSLTIHVHNKPAFQLFEKEVKQDYGEPTNMMHNGNIYRGFVSSGEGVTITLYQTGTVRVQGGGYAHWATKVLPKLARSVMAQLGNVTDESQTDPTVCSPSTVTESSSSQPPLSAPNFSLGSLLSSTPVHPQKSRISQSPSISLKSPSNSDHADDNTDKLQLALVENLITCVEERTKYKTENSMLRERVASLIQEVDKLSSKLAEEFSEERKHLLQQIQDLSSCKRSTSTCTASTQTTPYSDAVSIPSLSITTTKQSTSAPSSVLKHFLAEPSTQSNNKSTLSKPNVSSQQYNVPVSNRFTLLEPQYSDDTAVTRPSVKNRASNLITNNASTKSPQAKSKDKHVNKKTT